MKVIKNSLLLGVFLSNFAQGMFLIGVGKTLFDLTGSTQAFMVVLLVQLFSQMVINFAAGLVVDRHRPQLVLTLTCLGLGVGFAGGAEAFSLGLSPIVTALVVTVGSTVGVALLHIALFALSGELFNREQVKKFYAEQALCIQIGQILGGASVGVLIMHASTSAVLFGISLCYGIAAMVYGLVIDRRTARSSKEALAADQPSRRQSLRALLAPSLEFFANNSAARRILVWSTLPYVLVNCLNIALVPLVESVAQGDPLYLSWFDCSFACGAIAGGMVFRRWLGKRQGVLHIPLIVLAVTINALVFTGLCYGSWQAPSFIVPIFNLGVLATVWSISLMATLQEHTPSTIRGSTAASQQSATALLSSLLLPLFNGAIALHMGLAWFIPPLVAVVFMLALGIPEVSSFAGENS